MFYLPWGNTTNAMIWNINDFREIAQCNLCWRICSNQMNSKVGRIERGRSSQHNFPCFPENHVLIDLSISVLCSAYIVLEPHRLCILLDCCCPVERKISYRITTALLAPFSHASLCTHERDLICLGIFLKNCKNSQSTHRLE